MNTKNGLFITFEGGEGTGKSTQSKLLHDYFVSNKFDIILTREPGGCLESEEIRNLLVKGTIDKWDPITEALLHNAARREHVKKVIKPALENNKLVLCDRFIDSTIAYQGIGQGVDINFLNILSSTTTENIKPDITFIFDMDVNSSLKRAKIRDKTKKNRYEEFDKEFHEKIRLFFKSLVKIDKKYLILDATKSVEEIHFDIISHINKTVTY